MSLIVEFVNGHPEIDATRLYIGGCSNGGYMTINMLVSYPGVFAAAYPVCEPYANDWLTGEKLAALADTPIWLTAAKSDTIVTLYEGYWDEEPPFLYHVTADDSGQEVPVYEYSNALFDRSLPPGSISRACSTRCWTPPDSTPMNPGSPTSMTATGPGFTH